MLKNVILKTINGKVVELLGLTSEIRIYLDLYKEYITAELDIIDSHNLVYNLSLTGGEEIVLYFQDYFGSMPVTLSLSIIQFDSPERLSHSTNRQTFYLVSPEYFASSTGNQEAGRYDDQSHLIVESVLKKLHKTYGATAPFYYQSNKQSPKFNALSNQEYPFQLLRRIAHTVTDSRQAPWILYRDLYSYKYFSILDILRQPKYTDIVLQNDTTGNTVSNQLIAKTWWKDDNINKLHANVNNILGAKRQSLSLDSKTLFKSEFKTKDRFKSTLGSNPAIQSIADYEKNTEFYLNNDELTVEMSSMRNMTFRLLNEIVYYAELPLNTRLFGSVVNLDIQSKESTHSDRNEDKRNSGKFLCTSAKLTLGLVHHENKVLCEFSKDSTDQLY